MGEVSADVDAKANVPGMGRPRISDYYSFGQCVVESRHVLHAVGQIDLLNQPGSAHSTLIRWLPGENRGDNVHLDWYVQRILLLPGREPELFLMGTHGRGMRMLGANREFEHVDPSPRGPSVYGMLRDIRWIGNHLYATGMRRQVYRRDAPDRWVHMDQLILQQPSLTEAGGFNSIDGATEQDIVCVGLNGEVFGWNGHHWSREDAGTHAALHRVKFVNRDLAYACGDMGVLLRRSRGKWQPVDHKLTREQIRDIEFFAGKLYFATQEKLYRMDERDSVEEVQVPSDEDPSFGWLHVNDGVLMSSGKKHIFWTSDGSTWNRLA